MVSGRIAPRSEAPTTLEHSGCHNDKFGGPFRHVRPPPACWLLTVTSIPIGRRMRPEVSRHVSPPSAMNLTIGNLWIGRGQPSKGLRRFCAQGQQMVSSEGNDKSVVAIIAVACNLCKPSPSCALAAWTVIVLYCARPCCPWVSPHCLIML